MGTVQARSIVVEGPEFFNHARYNQCVRFEVQVMVVSQVSTIESLIDLRSVIPFLLGQHCTVSK